MVHKGRHFYGYARTVVVGVGSVSAGSTTDVPIWAAPFRCKIRACYIIPQADITGAATNYMTLKIVNKGSDGSATKTVASKAFTNGVNASDYTRTSLGDVSNNELNEGEVLQFKKEESGTGMAMPDLAVVIEYTKM